METTATASGKIILFGEHAVVYGQPAIAVPVSQVRATAIIRHRTAVGSRLHAPDIGQSIELSDAPMDHPLAAAVRIFQAEIEPVQLPALDITVTSTIPIAAGLGSGAAIAAAIIRALAKHLSIEHLLANEAVSRLTFEVERLHHGTPSGIDNSVVSYERPVYFVGDLQTTAPDLWERLTETGGIFHQPILETFSVGQPLTIVIGDTGIRARTKISVGDVRRQWEMESRRYNALFHACGAIADAAREAIERGDGATLGRLMNENQAVLEQLTVSSPELDRLIRTARRAGAFGAKLSGGGRGGNMIAFVDATNVTAVVDALYHYGANHVLVTTLS